MEEVEVEDTEVAEAIVGGEDCSCRLGSPRTQDPCATHIEYAKRSLLADMNLTSALRILDPVMRDRIGTKSALSTFVRFPAYE